MKRIVVGAALAVTFAAPGLGQEPLRAPLTLLEPSGQKVWRSLRVMVYGDGGRWDDPAAPMRAPAAIGTPPQWFDAKHALVRAYLAAPATSFWTSLTASVDEKGAITACEFRQPADAPLAPEALCDSLKAVVKFRPALDQAGAATSGKAQIAVGSYLMPVSNDAAPPPLIASDMNAAPPPPPPPPPPKLPSSFPPEPQWTGAYTAANLFATVPNSGPAPVGEPMTGLVFGGKASPLKGCAIIASSGDPAFDKAACRYIEKTVRPSWEPRVMPQRQAVAFLVGGTAKAPVAYYAEPRKALRPQVLETRRAEFYRAITALTGDPPAQWASAFEIAGEVDAQGRLSKCRISRSSGRDASDVAACRVAQQEGWLQPGRDVFGRPVGRRYFYWNASNEKPAGS